MSATSSSDPGRPEILIREAGIPDVAEILRQRRAMYEDMDYTDADALTAMERLCADYLAKALADRSFLAWLAFDGNRAVAGGAVIVTSWPAHPYDLECRRATILNVYTDRAFRRRGIATALMRTMIDWCAKNGLARVSLHASEDGRRLYDALGFEPSNEMRLNLR